MLLALLVLLGCSGSDDEPVSPAADDTGSDELAFDTDIDALRQIYPLGDLAVESVRWRRHTDFVAESSGSGRLLDDLPAQDADPILEAVFVFADPSIRDQVLAGRATTLPVVPSWYPDELAGLTDVAIIARADAIEGLPGEVFAFPDMAPYVVVRYRS